jgi:iron complex outermembrane receptor protein
MRQQSMSIVAASVIALSVGQAALAQPAQDNNSGIEEIVVTAQHRTESIQDVPISITALSGAALAQAGIQDTESLSDLTPGLLVARSVVGKISIRGIGNENYTISGDPDVAVHTDGVYVARATAGLFDFFDIDRVEVLRGPQGTLYGRNATGGVINVLPNTPTDTFAASIAADGGNYNAFRSEAMVNQPLSQDWAVRLAVMGNLRDGFTKNIDPTAAARGFGDLDNKDVLGIRAQIGTTTPGPFQARLSFEYLDDESNLPAYKYLNLPNALPNANFGGFGDASLRTVDQGFELNIPGTNRSVGSNGDVFKTVQTSGALHLSYDFDGIVLTSISGYRATKFNWIDDGDGSDVFYVNYIQQDSTEQLSQEFQLTGSFGDFNWLVGAYYLHEAGDSFIALPFPFGANLPFYILIDGSARTSAKAGYGELRWQALDELKITLGARYSDENKNANYRYAEYFGALSVVSPYLDANDKSFTPRLVADYTLLDNVSLYASATKGFKSGGFNLLAVQPGFAPEKVWSYELGAKTQFDNRRLTVNADVFYYDYKNIQVSQIVDLQSVISNAAAATVKGSEVEVAYRPIAPLDVGASFAYLDAVYNKFCTGDPTLPNAPVSQGCTVAAPINLKGNHFPRAPAITLSGNAAYTLDYGAAGSVTLWADARYQSKTYFTQFNRNLISQDGFGLVNSRVTWKSEDERYSLGLFVNNLFNKTYFTEVFESGAFDPQLVGQAVVGPPRTYGLSGSVKF